MKMFRTVDEVDARVADLRLRVAGRDNEAIHLDEDGLYLGVLRAIASGEAGDAAALAAAALKANEIHYDRWYA